MKAARAPDRWYGDAASTVLGRWSYAPLMPGLTLGGVGIGLSPLAQWLVVPPLALSPHAEKRG